MRLSLLIIFSFFLHAGIQAQKAFEYISMNNFNVASGFVEIDQEFIFVGPNESEGFILVKLDSTGMLLEQKEVAVLDSFVTVSGVYDIDSNLWVVGYGFDCKNCSIVETSVWVGRFSMDFELVSVQFWPLASKVYNLVSRIFLEDNSFILAGQLESQNGNKEYFAKYTPSTNDFLVKYNDFYGSLVPDVMSRKDSSGYIIYRANRLEYVDSLFNVINTFSSPALDTFSFVEGSLLERQDSTFVIFSEVLIDEKRSFLFGQIDRDYNLMSWDTLLSAPLAGISGVWNSTAHKDALVESPDGHYYVGGTHHYTPTQVKPFLVKYNHDMSQVWSFKYGTPGRVYYMLGMKETSDNGCMLYGLRNLDSQNYEAYILKVNADGILTGETIIPLKRIVTCYPNPATDYIQFDLPDVYQKARLELIDISGRVVLAQKMNHQELIDISFLPKGMYVYRVVSQQGWLMDVGKLVKE